MYCLFPEHLAKKPAKKINAGIWNVYIHIYNVSIPLNSSVKGSIMSPKTTKKINNTLVLSKYAFLSTSLILRSSIIILKILLDIVALFIKMTLYPSYLFNERTSWFLQVFHKVVSPL